MKNKDDNKIGDEIIPENDDNTGDDLEYSDDELRDTVKKLKAKIKELEKEKSEYLTGWQRAKADYVNFQKQSEESKRELIRFGNENLMAELLPTLDAFDMAMANKTQWESVDKNWRVGMEYIYKELLGALERNGLKQINPKINEQSEKFDPFKHNSVESVSIDDESKSGSIAEVLQKGYEINGRIIRPATVKVYEKSV